MGTQAIYGGGNLHDLNRIRISESPTIPIYSDGPVIAVPWISEMDRYFWQRAPNHLLCNTLRMFMIKIDQTPSCQLILQITNTRTFSYVPCYFRKYGAS